MLRCLLEIGEGVEECVVRKIKRPTLPVYERSVDVKRPA